MDDYDKTVHEIRPYLYLSGYLCLNENVLNEYGITHAVDATNFPHCLRMPEIEYFSVDVDDSETADLRKYFEPVTKFIVSAQRSVGVLVGMQRNLGRKNIGLLCCWDK